MRTLFLDCGMGAAGDMLMAALYDLLPEVEQKTFIDKMNSAGIPGLEIEATDDQKCGIVGKHMKVFINGTEEGHEHNHEHEHHHGRSLRDVLHVIRDLQLSDRVIQDACRIYESIAAAESQVHGTTVSEIHFHEVGMLDAIADVVGVSLLMEMIAPEQVVVSPVNLGSGTTKCAHGRLPVPAPATALLIQGIPAYSGEVRGELTTPTGAALLKYYGQDFAKMPEMSIESIGYGTGTKDFPVANLVRAIIGQGVEKPEERIIELSCNMDDMTGEDVGFLLELLLEKGAKEVYTTPVYMKKNRPGILLTVLCDVRDKKTMAELIFKHSTTIGIREREFSRMVLDRKIEKKKFALGELRVKSVSGYGVKREKLEYDDVKRIAEREGMSLQEVKENFFNSNIE